MGNNGHRRTHNFAAEFLVDYEARRLPACARPTLLDLFRRAKTKRPRRTFWELDPATGEWRLI